MADQVLRNISNGPRYAQADPKKSAIAIMPGKFVPATKALLECDDVKRLLRNKHLRLDNAPAKSTKKDKGGGD